MKLKSYITKVFSLVLTISILFTTSVSAYSNNKSYDSYKKYAQNFMNKFNSNCKLTDPIELYNFQNDVQALLFQSDLNNGYIVINLSDNSIPEFSPKNKNKFVLNKNVKYFYNGALNYFEQSNEQIINCATKQKMGKLKDLKNITYPIQPNKNTIPKTNLTSNNANYTLRNTLPNYDYNPDGRCVATATAMLLAYYAKFWPKCSDYVEESILKYPSEAHQRDLTNKLIKATTGLDYIPKDSKGNSEGINPSLVPAGINKYLREVVHARNIINFTFQDNMYNYEYTVINALQNDKPILLSLYNHAPYIDPENGVYGHAVTAWGYCVKDNNKFFIINDGWGSNFAYVSPDYVSNMVY